MKKTPIFIYGQTEIDYLMGKDKRLGGYIASIGLIERKTNPDLFAALVNSIVGQQISAKAQITIWNRMCDTLGVITAEAIYPYL
jgi:3-methyladenine DNA glycosylase/8-oxoguanine DNA glycosylase